MTKSILLQVKGTGLQNVALSYQCLNIFPVWRGMLKSSIYPIEKYILRKVSPIHFITNPISKNLYVLNISLFFTHYLPCFEILTNIPARVHCR